MPEPAAEALGRWGRDRAVYHSASGSPEEDQKMAQRHQRGWLKERKRSQGEKWVLFFQTTRKADGKRVENKIPGELIKDFPDKRCAWSEIGRLHLPINPDESLT